MSRIIPALQLTPDKIMSVEKSIEQELKAFAAKETGKGVDEFVVRAALPSTDFSLTNEEWVTGALGANAWTKYFDQKLPDDKFVAFYKYANEELASDILHLKFKLGSAGATTKDIIGVQELLPEEKLVGFYDAIMYKGGDHVYIEVYSRGVGAEHAVLGCMVVEPKGGEIS